MDFKNINKEWLKIWGRIDITEDSFVTANNLSKKCIKQIGIEPTCCIKNFGKQCDTCWSYVYSAMWKKHIFK